MASAEQTQQGKENAIELAPIGNSGNQDGTYIAGSWTMEFYDDLPKTVPDESVSHKPSQHGVTVRDDYSVPISKKDSKQEQVPLPGQGQSIRYETTKPRGLEDGKFHIDQNAMHDNLVQESVLISLRIILL